jgi:hypothetical protein
MLACAGAAAWAVPVASTPAVGVALLQSQAEFIPNDGVTEIYRYDVNYAAIADSTKLSVVRFPSGKTTFTDPGVVIVPIHLTTGRQRCTTPTTGKAVCHYTEVVNVVTGAGDDRITLQIARTTSDRPDSFATVNCGPGNDTVIVRFPTRLASASGCETIIDA